MLLGCGCYRCFVFRRCFRPISDRFEIVGASQRLLQAAGTLRELRLTASFCCRTCVACFSEGWWHGIDAGLPRDMDLWLGRVRTTQELASLGLKLTRACRLAWTKISLDSSQSFRTREALAKEKAARPSYGDPQGCR